MTLKVPEVGLQLHSPPGSDRPPPPQIFGLSLKSSVLDSLIQTVREGGSIQLALGKNPTLQYGSKTHRIVSPRDSAPYEIYQTHPWESSRNAVRVPVTTSLFTKPPSAKSNKTSLKEKSDSTLDSGATGLLNERADSAKEKNPKDDNIRKAAKSKSKLLSGYNAVPRLMTTSPAHITSPSPAVAPALSASQQAVERAKEQRLPLVHELAVGERQMDYLQKKWVGRTEDFKPCLEKVAEYHSDTKRYSMKKPFWKELDVWNYKYDNLDDRKVAIENAIRQYDKQRLSAFEPEWQRLLVKEERDKGTCLSRLQASLARGPAQPAPKNKGQKTDESCSSKEDGDARSLGSDQSRVGGESMSRSNSAAGVTKIKKPAKEPQAKRPPAATKYKATVPKPSATKPKAAPSKVNGGRVLSQAIIENSDSSGDDMAGTKCKNNGGPAKEASRRATAKPVTKAAPAAKRALEGDESSSSSGTPLSKRLKQKPALQVNSKPKGGVAEAGKPCRTGAKVLGGTKVKKTWPTKSSPLALSPPTNASEMETDNPSAAGKKRKSEADDSKSTAKRRAIERVPVEVLNKATKFKASYAKYESLHYQIAGLEHPPEEKVKSLVDMRDRLATMKREIYGYREIMA